MRKDEYNVIVGKVADGVASESEIALYNAYYNQYQLKYPRWDKLKDEEKQLMLNETEQGIHAQLNKNIITKKARLWPVLTRVAAAVTLITLSVWMYNSYKNPVQVNNHVYLNDVLPGKNVAVLTLANGKTVNLSDTKTGIVIGNDLRYSDNTVVVGSEGFGSPENRDGKGTQADTKIQVLNFSTPIGGTYMVTLPDGTKVWLNAASKLEFPSNLKNAKQRVVRLIGEAYFEVFKNKLQPFIVKNERQEIEVLGTQFNVSAYEDERVVKTTLLEGSVRINNSVVIKPGEQAAGSGNDVVVKKVDVEAAIGWKNEDFVFSGEDFKSAMNEIARWYGIIVDYDISVPTDVKLDGWVSRKSNLSVVLRRIESIGNVHFKLEGRRVTVTK